MRDKTANFRVAQNRGFWKWDTTGDSANETKAPICNDTGHQFRSLTKRNINETETPLHKITYFKFCGIVFFIFSGTRRIWDGYYQFRYIKKKGFHRNLWCRHFRKFSCCRNWNKFSHLDGRRLLEYQSLLGCLYRIFLRISPNSMVLQKINRSH